MSLVETGDAPMILCFVSAEYAQQLVMAEKVRCGLVSNTSTWLHDATRSGEDRDVRKEITASPCIVGEEGWWLNAMRVVCGDV